MSADSAPRIGVFICHCGLNIAATVDVLSVCEYAKGLSNVEHSIDLMFTCSSDGLKTIQEAIKELHLNRVIVASCTPRTHEPIFRRVIEEAGLNRFLFEMVNIREHVSWCHMHDEIRATEKAKILVEMAVARARALEPLMMERVPVIPEVAVIGGGVAGISAALNAANSGYKVHLVEREPTIGGQMALLDKVFPQNDCAICILGPIMAAVEHHPRINLLTFSEVEEVSGFVGNFQMNVRKKARYIDTDKCNSCGECVTPCPISIPNKYEYGLASRKAVFRPFPQAVPNTYTIEKKGYSPCRDACPAGMNNQAFVALLRDGRFKEALNVIRDAVPFPRILGRVCHHPCEDNCLRSDHDEAVAIMQLKRFVADYVHEQENDTPEVIAPIHKEKVAIIGAGPSGLTCALELLLKGYHVTIFDALTKPGGLLSNCLPDYRIPEKVANEEIDWVLGHGIDVKTNVRIGEDITFDDLKRDYDSIYIAIGSQNPAKLEIDGSNLKGVLYGLTFLRDVKNGKTPKNFGDNIVVIGGGNVGIDCARTALRLGAKKVRLVCLETRNLNSRDRMPAHDWEIEEAEEEGIIILDSLGPDRITGKEGKVTGLETKVCSSVYSTEGSFMPIFPGESGPTIQGNTVIIAIGQRIDLRGFEQLQTTERGTISVNDVSLETNIPGVFAGGDTVTGPASVIEAIAQGKEAAISIDRQLMGVDLYEGRSSHMRIVTGSDIDYTRYPIQSRMTMPKISKKDRRNSFNEIERGFSMKAAIAEAERCLACAVCCECNMCLDKCEPDAIIHDMEDDIVTLNVGAIIVATGAQSYFPLETREYGYGVYSNVITNAQLERLTNAAGPTGGKIKRPSDKKTPSSVAFIQCVGSRDLRMNCDYCCYVGCENSLKQATQIKEKYPETEVAIFAVDIRTHGTGYEDLYRRAREMGVLIIKGRPSELEEESTTKSIRVLAEDLYTGRNVSLTYDMVVLATALHPQPGTRDMARLVGINTDQYGFFLSAHPKLRPVDSFKDGIFIAGSCLGPMDITKAVSTGNAASAMAQALLSPGYFNIEPIYAEIDVEKCFRCDLCTDLCPYSAPTLIDNQMAITKELCQGCGTCAAGCPHQAIDMKHYRRHQLDSMIEIAARGLSHSERTH